MEGVKGSTARHPFQAPVHFPHSDTSPVGPNLIGTISTVYDWSQDVTRWVLFSSAFYFYFYFIFACVRRTLLTFLACTVLS